LQARQRGLPPPCPLFVARSSSCIFRLSRFSLGNASRNCPSIPCAAPSDAVADVGRSGQSLDRNSRATPGVWNAFQAARPRPRNSASTPGIRPRKRV
jgi:hypothetical protein